MIIYANLVNIERRVVQVVQVPRLSHVAIHIIISRY